MSLMPILGGASVPDSSSTVASVRAARAAADPSRSARTRPSCASCPPLTLTVTDRSPRVTTTATCVAAIDTTSPPHSIVTSVLPSGSTVFSNLKVAPAAASRTPARSRVSV